MKTSLKIIALIIAAGYPVVALAQLAGLSTPSYFSPEYVLGLFTASVVGLTFFSDYSRRIRDLTVTQAPVIVPPAGAFENRCAKAECLAA